MCHSCLFVFTRSFSSRAAACGPPGARDHPLRAEWRGSIINISSTASAGEAQAAIYSGTKGAVDAITRGLAAELGPRKIRVNSVNPGMVITEGATAGGFTEGDFRKALEAQTPLGRIGQPDDIAPAAVFFASDDSKWVTGETLRIAGGLR